MRASLLPNVMHLGLTALFAAGGALEAEDCNLNGVPDDTDLRARPFGLAGTGHPVDLGVSPWYVAAADLDGDGDPDLAAADSGSDTLLVLRNEGNRVFSVPVSPAAGSSPVSVAAGDPDGDQDLDLVVANLLSNDISVFINLSDAAWLLGHLFLGRSPTLPCDGGSAVEPGPAARELLDTNGDGRVDISDAVSVLAWLFLGGDPPVLGANCTPIPGCSDVCAE